MDGWGCYPAGARSRPLGLICQAFTYLFKKINKQEEGVRSGGSTAVRVVRRVVHVFMYLLGSEVRGGQEVRSKTLILSKPYF